MSENRDMNVMALEACQEECEVLRRKLLIVVGALRDIEEVDCPTKCGGFASKALYKIGEGKR
jgi:hypothetical protein